MIFNFERTLILSKLLAFVIILSGLTGCNTGSCDVKTIEQKLNEILKIGDRRDKVEIVIKDLEIKFTYDEFQHRYNGVSVKGCYKNESIIIYLNFDKTDSLSSIEVTKEYTWW